MEIIKSLEKIHFDEIYATFSEAFKEYEVQIDKDELQIMLQRRGYVPELSFGAFKDHQLVAFTFNGIGMYHGVKTAYDTGSGTIKDYRGQGLITKIFNHSLPFLKEAGVSHYLLEVLQHNTQAVSLYKDLGFKVCREFNYFLEPKESITLLHEIKDPTHQIKPIGLTSLKEINDFWDFNPSWQNSMEAIERRPENFKMLGLFRKQKMKGYCILEPNSGDIAQIAVAKDYRRKGVGSLLLREILKYNQSKTVKLINSERGCNSITSFLDKHAMTPKGMQYEMVKTLE